MSRNGSGTYSPPTNSWNPATDGTPATASDWQAVLTDLSNALTQSVSKDGQTAMTGNLSMGGSKLTSLGAGVNAGDSLRFEQLFSQGQQTDIASAATCDIGAVNSTILNVTGTTTITSFGVNYNGPRFVKFAGILTLTYNATTLILPSGADIITAVGDTAILVPNGSPASGWRLMAFQRAAGISAIAGPLASSGITGAAASGANVDITSLGNNTSTIYTTAGTSTAYTLTPAPVITAYTAGQSFFVNFNAACGASPTLQISGIATPPNLVRRLSDGTYQNVAANEIPANHRSRVTLISATQALVESLPSVYVGSPVTTVSGTSVTLSGIPTGVKRASLLLNAVSTNGAAFIRFRLNSVTSGYASTATYVGTGTGGTDSTAGFDGAGDNNASWLRTGRLDFILSETNTWTISGGYRFATGFSQSHFGNVALGAALSQIVVTTTNGTDTFDNGSVTMIYEY